MLHNGNGEVVVFACEATRPDVTAPTCWCEDARDARNDTLAVSKL